MTRKTNRPYAAVLLVVLGAAVGLSEGCKRKPLPQTRPPETLQTRPSQATPEPATPADAPTPRDPLGALDAVEKAWAQTHSLSAKVETFVAQAIGRPGKTVGTGTYDLLKEHDKTKIRFYVENVLHIAILKDTDLTEETNRSELRTAEFLYWVTDGVVLYQSTRQAQKYYVVTKTWLKDSDILQVGGPSLLDTLRSERRLDSVEDVDLDGQPAFVFKAVVPGADGYELHYFDKATGIRLRFAQFDADGVKTFELILSELRTNVEFTPVHFTFEIPENATLVDKTKD